MREVVAKVIRSTIIIIGGKHIRDYAIRVQGNSRSAAITVAITVLLVAVNCPPHSCKHTPHRQNENGWHLSAKVQSALS